MPTTHIPRSCLAHPATVQGIGLFTEQPCTCTISPADAGTGLVFVRADRPDSVPIAATIANLSHKPIHPAFAGLTPRCSSLARRDAEDIIVHTTEHILGALLGLGITDATISLTSPEVPIGDGSGRAFVDAIVQAGITKLDEQLELVSLDKPLRVSNEENSAWIIAEPLGPGEKPSFVYELDYGEHASIAAQRASWDMTTDAFVRTIAPARTFCLAAEAQQMRALGLFSQFSPSDLLVIDAQGEPIDNAWRGEAEPARHKLLDLLGDLALTGVRFSARFTSVRGGHRLNHAMAQALVDAR